MNFDNEVYKFRWEKALPSHAIEGLVQWVKTICEDPSVLEIGPGAGHVAAAIVNKGLEYRGLETSLAMSEETNKLLGKRLVSHYSGFPWPISNPVDVILGVRVFHLLDVEMLIGEVDRLLKPGGNLLVVDIKRPKDSLRSVIKQQLREMLSKQGVKTSAGNKKLLDEQLKTKGWGFMEFSAGSWDESYTLRTMLSSWFTKDGLMGVSVSPEIKEETIRMIERFAVEKGIAIDVEKPENVWLNCKVYIK